jgi:hypothetical protein
MNRVNENQHFVSKVLLERFKVSGEPLQCFQIATRQWEPKGLRRICAAQGYNQLLVPGEPPNNTLEASFSRVESSLRKTLNSLEGATPRHSTELQPAVYRNLWEFCTFLKLSSLFSKASAVVSFLAQLNMELGRDRYDLWHELKIPQQIIHGFRQEYLNGGRVIIETENPLQLIYRLQFERLFRVNFHEFRNAEWVISTSPVDLPMSDIGIVPIHMEDLKMNHYLLPIAPRLLLHGLFYHDLSKNTPRTTIRSLHLTYEEAEDCLDKICLSSVREVICSRRSADIPKSLSRAKSKGLHFASIVNPELVTAAGVKHASRQYSFKCVSEADYVRFVHSFIIPHSLPKPPFPDQQDRQ